MTRKEVIKYFTHLLMLMLFALPVLVVLNLFVFNNLSNGLAIFLDVVVGLIVVIVVEVVLTKINKKKQEKINKK